MGIARHDVSNRILYFRYWALSCGCGSGSSLTLPSSDYNEQIRLVVTRSPDSALGLLQFGFASIKLSVLYARRVVIEVFDPERNVSAHHVVRSSTPGSSCSNSCSSSSRF